MSDHFTPEKDAWPATLAVRIDEICLRFEKAWKSGSRPSIANFLDEEEQNTIDHKPADVSPEPTSPFPAIAGYEIVDALKPGGMGIVYQARQEGLNRLVALKVIKSWMRAANSWQPTTMAAVV